MFCAGVVDLVLHRAFPDILPVGVLRGRHSDLPDRDGLSDYRFAR